MFQMLLRGFDASSVVNEWWETHQRCDLRVRRAKTDGCVVIETTGILFTSHVLRLWPGTKVNIKEPK